MGLFDLFKKKQHETKSSPEIRLGFILLDSIHMDWDEFISNMQKDWAITIAEKPTDEGQLVFEAEGMNVACGFIEAVVPNNEAVDNARNNFLWKEAVQVTETHKAQVILSVMRGSDPIKQSLLFTKAASSMLKLNNAIGIYQTPTVLSSKFYINVAQDIKEGKFPILDWIYFGVYPDGGKFTGYTVGLNYFGKEEIEVIKTKQRPDDLYGFLVDIASYVISMNVTLKHGETIGFTEEQKFRITRSKGVSVENESIKIEF